MNKHLFANAKHALLRLLILGMLVPPFGCTKNPETDSKKQQPAMATSMDSLLTIPVPDSLPIAPTIIVNEHGFLTICWGGGDGHLLDTDSFHYVLNNDRYTDVRIRTPSDSDNLSTVLYLPRDFLAVREILTQYMDTLRFHNLRVRGMGTIYTERHDLDTCFYQIQPGFNDCGMTWLEYEWFTANGWTVTDTSIWEKQLNPNSNYGWTVVDTTMSKNYKPFGAQRQFDTALTTMNRQRHNVRQHQGR